jgi:hypothetical protein
VIPDTVVKTPLILYGTCFNPVSVAGGSEQTQLAVAVPAIKKRIAMERLNAIVVL